MTTIGMGSNGTAPRFLQIARTLIVQPKKIETMSPKHKQQKDAALAKYRQVMRLQYKAWTTEEGYIPAIGSYILLAL